MTGLYDEETIGGIEYTKYHDLHGYTIYIETDLERITKENLYGFLEKQNREWMNKHIGSRADKHFRRSEDDKHWYEMSHPQGSTVKVLVRQR